LDAVPSDTPACSATSRIVTRPMGAWRALPTARRAASGPAATSSRLAVNAFLSVDLSQRTPAKQTMPANNSAAPAPD
jgi:hypothetical protein